MYNIIRNFLFLFDPEKVHYFSMNGLKFFCKIGFIKAILKECFQSKSPKTILGLNFSNPVGLGAGFDKNAAYLTELETLGFGFIEIGTVTPKPQDGNEKPRLFRLPKDKALINRMGFNNDGVEVIANLLSTWRKNNPNTTLIIGGNIGKNKITENEKNKISYSHSFVNDLVPKASLH
jgi:dihydroorotate dehydrogenase